MSDKEFKKALREALDSGVRAAEIAVEADVSTATIYAWLRDDEVPKNRLVRAAIEKYLAKRSS